MSTNFGCADDFKVNGNNPVTLNIDVRRIYKRFSDNFMSMSLAKSKYVGIKGRASVSLTKYAFEKAETRKKFGVLFSENLSWSPHAKERAKTDIKALYTLKRNMQKVHLSIEKMHMSLMLFQSSTTHRPYRCPTKET